MPHGGPSIRRRRPQDRNERGGLCAGPAPPIDHHGHWAEVISSHWASALLGHWLQLCPLPGKHGHIHKVFSHNAKGLLKPIHGPQVKTARSTDPWGLSAQKTILKLTWLCNTCLQWRRQESWPSERNSSVPMDSVFWFSTMNIYWAPFACEALGQIAVCADEQGMYPVS